MRIHNKKSADGDMELLASEEIMEKHDGIRRQIQERIIVSPTEGRTWSEEPLVCMKILKIGGSILTREKEIREDAIERMTSEISSSWRELILIHGVGYFGHPQAHLYKLNEGLSLDNKTGLYETHRAVIKLNKKILDSFADKGVPVMPIHPLSCITGKNGRINSFNIGCIELAVKNGFLPILHGDVVLDSTRGCCIISGDQLVSYIAKKLNTNESKIRRRENRRFPHIEKIGVATNVDGVYDKDGKIVREINPSNLKTILNQKFEGGKKYDVTGGMLGKVIELTHIKKESLIFNGEKEGLIRKFLNGAKLEGTVIRGFHLQL